MYPMQLLNSRTRVIRGMVIFLCFLYISNSHATLDLSATERIAAWSVLRLQPDSEIMGPPVGDVLIIDPVSLEQLHAADELVFDLPNDTVVAIKESFQSRNDGHGHWVGKIESRRSYYMVSLTVLDGKMAGLLQTQDGDFEIMPRGKSNTSAVVDVSGIEFPGCENKTESPPSRDSIGAQPSDPHSVGTSTTHLVEGDSEPLPSSVPIDLLVLYSPEVLAHFDGDSAAVETHATAAVDVANTAFIASDMIPFFRVPKIALLDVSEDSYPGDTLNDVLLWMSDEPRVQNIRDDIGADMIGLIVEDGRGMCGGAQIMRTPSEGFESHALQATRRSCAVGNMTYAHEHGHNLGFEHNPKDSVHYPDNASFPWSFGHLEHGSFRTIMSLSSECQNGCPRVMHFSNPDVNYDQLPTGINEERDNARTGDSVAELVAGFREDVVFQNGFE